PSKLIANRVRPAMMKRGEVLEINDICQVLAIDLLGIVPEDEKVIAGSNAGEPVAMNPPFKSGLAYRNIARRMLGDMVPFMTLKEQTWTLTNLRKYFRMSCDK